MPHNYCPATGDDIEFKAYSRAFENPGDDERNASVLYVVATLSKPDSGWDFLLVEQAGEPDVWRLLEDPPAFDDADRTYYIACGTSERALDAVPKSIQVITHAGTTRVSVAPWD